MADMIIACLMNIPFTGVGKASVAQVQSILNQSPRGIPIPVLQPIINIDTLSSEEKGMIGDWSMYNKQIGTKSEVSYPIILKNMSAYFENDEQHPGNNFLQYPFVFINDLKDNSRISIEKFTPNKITLQVTTDSSSKIILQQNYYPHWYYINGQNKMEVEKAGINFMSGHVSKGSNIITFSFEPTLVKWTMLLSAILFVIYCLFLFIPIPKQSFPS